MSVMLTDYDKDLFYCCFFLSLSALKEKKSKPKLGFLAHSTIRAKCGLSRAQYQIGLQAIAQEQEVDFIFGKGGQART